VTGPSPALHPGLCHRDPLRPGLTGTGSDEPLALQNLGREPEGWDGVEGQILLMLLPRGVSAQITKCGILDTLAWEWGACGHLLPTPALLRQDPDVLVALDVDLE
jgi:hypothetical protein